jgi:hypothetical protein
MDLNVKVDVQWLSWPDALAIRADARHAVAIRSVAEEHALARAAQPLGSRTTFRKQFIDGLLVLSSAIKGVISRTNAINVNLYSSAVGGHSLINIHRAAYVKHAQSVSLNDRKVAVIRPHHLSKLLYIT